MVHHKQLQGKDGRKSAQKVAVPTPFNAHHGGKYGLQWSSSCISVLTIIVATATHFGSIIKRTSSNIIIPKAKQLALEAVLLV